MPQAPIKASERQPVRCIVETTYPYTYIDKEANVHVFIPVTGGDSTALENTCQSTTEMRKFFSDGPDSGLGSVRRHIANIQYNIELLTIDQVQNNSNHSATFARQEKILSQLKRYEQILQAIKPPLAAALNMGSYPDYPAEVGQLLAENGSNGVGVRFSPRDEDGYLRLTRPLFSVTRSADGWSKSTQGLGFELRRVLGTQDFSNKPVPQELSEEESGGLRKRAIRNAVEIYRAKSQEKFGKFAVRELGPSPMQIFIDSLTEALHKNGVEVAITESGIAMDAAGDEFDANTHDLILNDSDTLEGYLENLFNYLHDANKIRYAPSLSNPFDTAYEDGTPLGSRREQLSIHIQRLLAEINCYCYEHRMIPPGKNKNFGQLIEQELQMSPFIAAIQQALAGGAPIDDAIIQHFNNNYAAFSSRRLYTQDIAAIKKRFAVEVTITKEAPHFDEFLKLLNIPGKFVSCENRIGVHLGHFLEKHNPILKSSHFLANGQGLSTVIALEPCSAAQAEEDEKEEAEERNPAVFLQTKTPLAITTDLGIEGLKDSPQLMLTLLLAPKYGPNKDKYYFEILSPEEIEQLKKMTSFLDLTQAAFLRLEGDALDRFFSKVSGQCVVYLDPVTERGFKAAAMQKAGTNAHKTAALEKFRPLGRHATLEQAFLDLGLKIEKERISLNAQGHYVLSNLTKAQFDALKAAQPETSNILHISQSMAESLYREVKRLRGEDYNFENRTNRGIAVRGDSAGSGVQKSKLALTLEILGIEYARLKLYGDSGYVMQAKPNSDVIQRLLDFHAAHSERTFFSAEEVEKLLAPPYFISGNNRYALFCEILDKRGIQYSRVEQIAGGFQVYCDPPFGVGAKTSVTLLHDEVADLPSRKMMPILRIVEEQIADEKEETPKKEIYLELAFPNQTARDKFLTKMDLPKVFPSSHNNDTHQLTGKPCYTLPSDHTLRIPAYYARNGEISGVFDNNQLAEKFKKQTNLVGLLTTPVRRENPRNQQSFTDSAPILYIAERRLKQPSAEWVLDIVDLELLEPLPSVTEFFAAPPVSPQASRVEEDEKEAGGPLEEAQQGPTTPAPLEVPQEPIPKAGELLEIPESKELETLPPLRPVRLPSPGLRWALSFLAFLTLSYGVLGALGAAVIPALGFLGAASVGIPLWGFAVLALFSLAGLILSVHSAVEASRAINRSEKEGLELVGGIDPSGRRDSDSLIGPDANLRKARVNNGQEQGLELEDLGKGPGNHPNSGL